MRFFRTKIRGALRRTLQQLRIWRYALLSDIAECKGKAILLQPALMSGAGSIAFNGRVTIGIRNSPRFWDGYAHLECRAPEARIEIGTNTWINNGFCAIAETTSITIGNDCLIGPEVMVVDSDFHVLDPARRFGHHGEVVRRPVTIGDNVFLGARCTILKGTNIGDGCVVGAGAVVSGSFPRNSLIVGTPANAVRML